MRWLTVPVAVLALAGSAAPALAKNGVTPISPKSGDSVPEGSRPTFKMTVRGAHKGVFVHICKSPRKDRAGMICKDDIGRARKQSGSRYAFKAKFFDYPGFWLNRPGTYYWQAYRSACNRAITDCKAEGPVVKFKVA